MEVYSIDTPSNNRKVLSIVKVFSPTKLSSRVEGHRRSTIENWSLKEWPIEIDLEYDLYFLGE